MKKKFFSLFLCGILSICLAFSSCQYLSFPDFMPKSIVSALINDNGELVVTYSDNTTQNLGVVKGENGKDGKDGVDLTPCAHTYGDWQTQLAPSCTSIGYDTRSCSLCGNLDYLITNPSGHTYENPVDLVHTCQQHFLNKTCITCGDTALVEEPATKDHFYGDWKTVEEYACGAIKQEKSCIYCNEKQIQTLNFSAHTFDENTLCTTCGHQEFIESEEYIEETEYYGPFYTWMSVDGTYGLKIMTDYNNTLFIYGYVGTPVNVVIPTSINGKTITSIGGGYGYGGIASAFSNCTTLEYIVIPNTINQIFSYAFDNCTSLKAISPLKSLITIYMYAFRSCSSLSMIILPKSLKSMLYKPFEGCNSLERVYYSGSINEWNTISFAYGKTDIKDQYIYYYSESKPTEKGNYWHYINGEPVIWEI